MKQNSLDGFTLYYERLESEMSKAEKAKASKEVKTPVKQAKKVPLKTRLQKIVKVGRGKVDNIILKVRNPRKKAKKTTKMEREALLQQRKNGILGIGLLLVVVSIAYSTYIVRTFVDTELSLLALAPQLIFALYILLKAFSKLYK